MSQYPHDEFDDIDENTARRGTYRGVIDDPSKSPKGIIPVVVAGILSLVIGGAMYINHPRSSSPEAAARVKSYSAPASPSESSSPSASASEQAKDANVAVYNASAPGGSAAKASAALEGYTITETANWSGTPSAVQHGLLQGRGQEVTGRSYCENPEHYDGSGKLRHLDSGRERYCGGARHRLQLTASTGLISRCAVPFFIPASFGNVL